MVSSASRFSRNHQPSLHLQDKQVRQKFNQISSQIRKLCLKESNVEFLQDCVKAKVIPQSFRIRNHPQNKNSKFNDKWTSAAKTASLQWIKMVIQDEQTFVKSIKEKVETLKDSFLSTLPVNQVSGFNIAILKKTQFFQSKFKAQKCKKFNWLAGFDVSHNDYSAEKNAEKKRKKKKWVTKTKYRRQRKKEQRQKINVVFNYSDLVLTDAMNNLLNRGLNFAITPLHLNLTQVLVDFAKFERRLLWKEFFADEDNEPTLYVPPIFKKEKYNLPRNHTVPSELKMFINGVKSEILDPENRNCVRPNLPPNEIEALNTLIQLQKSRVITIKPCDKGAGIIILNFKDYVTSCTNHLQSTQQQPDGQLLPYYEKVDSQMISETKDLISQTLKSGLENKWINKDEFDAMQPSDKKPGKFYQLFKVHKEHKEGETPPGRPIISGSGSFTENISIFADHFLKPLSDQHPSYLQDTPDFLRFIDNYNSSVDQVKGILVTIDVSALYTNIPQEEGLHICRAALDTRANKDVPSDFIIALLAICLKYNIFEYGKDLYRQLIGTAMGIHPAPSYANLFMAMMDRAILQLGGDSIGFLKRFLDDIICLWKGSLEDLYSFIRELNQLHPTIKFTFTHSSPYECMITENHDCWCHNTKAIPFLDTQIWIENGKFYTDLYRKPTDRCQYLLPSSCHPAHITENIPYSLAYRIIRICSTSELRDQRLQELREFLLQRNYSGSLVDNALDRAKLINRNHALQRKDKKKDQLRVVFALEYDPRLPSISSILQRHWRTMVQDPRMKEVFSEPPMVAFRRPTNLREKLVKAKLPPSGREKRTVKGMKRCEKNCPSCPFIQEQRIVRCTKTNKSVEINAQCNCKTSNVVYIISCTQCPSKYIGKTERTLDERVREHIGYVRNKQLHQPTGEHFNQPGHQVHHLRASVLEKVFTKDRKFVETRESLYIREFQTTRYGLNKKK